MRKRPISERRPSSDGNRFVRILHHRRGATILLLSFLLAACSSPPDYEPPPFNPATAHIEVARELPEASPQPLLEPEAPPPTQAAEARNPEPAPLPSPLDEFVPSHLDGTTVQVTDRVILPSPHRLGVNIQHHAYFGDHQVVARPFAHGEFRKGRQTSVIQVGESTADTVLDGRYDPAKPGSGYATSFAGGTYTVATGTRAGESGTILAHAPGSGLYRLERSGIPLQKDDVVWLRGPLATHAVPPAAKGEQMLGIGDFRVDLDDKTKLAFTDAAGDPTDQYVCYVFGDHDGRASGKLRHYIRAEPGARYRVRIRARSEGKGARIVVDMQNFGVPGNASAHRLNLRCDQDSNLDGEWRDFVFEGEVGNDPRVHKKFTAVNVYVQHEGRSGPCTVQIDRVVLEDLAHMTPSGFDARLVNTLKEARCGTLRFYGIAGMGSLVDDITAADAAQSTWAFESYSYGYRFQGADAVVDQWLALSKEVGAAPWLTIGGANGPADWRALVSYLAAPADFDEHSARRAAHGFAQPWVEEFPEIYLEIGNEWWNGIFKPYYVWPSQKYGELCNTIISAVRAHPHFSDRIRIVCGGWAVNGHHWNTHLNATAQGHDRISIAPYLLNKLDDASTVEARYGSLFASVESYLREGGQSTLEGMARGGGGAGLGIYELNTHLTSGKADAAAASEICTSVAAGVAVLDQAMACMSGMKTDPINYFTSLQRAYKDRLGLWGNLLVKDGEFRPRPVWHGLRLANQFLIDGDLVTTQVANSPVWDQPENGSIDAMKDVPYVHAYAFLQRNAEQVTGANVLVINRHRTDALPLYFALPFTPGKKVARAVLTSGDITDNNEEEERVTLSTDSLSGFDPDAPVSVPPHSAMVFQFTPAS